MAVDVFTVHVVGAGGKGAAVLAAGVALLEAVQLESWKEMSFCKA